MKTTTTGQHYPSKKSGNLAEEAQGEHMDLPEHLCVEDFLGSGAYGTVCAVRNRLTQEVVAVKKCKRVFASKTLAKRTLREIKLLRVMNHPNIVSLHSVLLPPHCYARQEDKNSVDDRNNTSNSTYKHSDSNENDNNNDNNNNNNEECVNSKACVALFEEVYLVFEQMEADLATIIRSQQTLQVDHVQYFMTQLFAALQYLHEANIIHRDLKPRNILINADCTLKVADFGLARWFEDGRDRTRTAMTDYVTTRWYRAPEVLCGWTDYGSKVDLWAAGCILVELFTRTPLFPAEDTKKQLECIARLLGRPCEEFVSRCLKSSKRNLLRSMKPPTSHPLREVVTDAPSAAIDLVEQLLDFGPQHRPSARECLRHPFLSVYASELERHTLQIDRENFHYEQDKLTIEILRKEMILEIDRVNASRNPSHTLSLSSFCGDDDDVEDSRTRDDCPTHNTDVAERECEPRKETEREASLPDLFSLSQSQTLSLSQSLSMSMSLSEGETDVVGMVAVVNAKRETEKERDSEKETEKVMSSRPQSVSLSSGADDFALLLSALPQAQGQTTEKQALLRKKENATEKECPNIASKSNGHTNNSNSKSVPRSSFSLFECVYCGTALDEETELEEEIGLSSTTTAAVTAVAAPERGGTLRARRRAREQTEKATSSVGAPVKTRISKSSSDFCRIS